MFSEEKYNDCFSKIVHVFIIKIDVFYMCEKSFKRVLSQNSRTNEIIHLKIKLYIKHYKTHRNVTELKTVAETVQT